MSIEIEGAPAPDSLEAKAIAELENEGHVIEGKQPAEDSGSPEPAKEEPKAEPEKEPAPEPEKPERSPVMVEAWKLRVAEDQKGALAQQVTELQGKLETLSKQTTPTTQAQKDEISGDVEAIIKEAEENGTDGTFLRKFASTILNKTKPSPEIEKTLKTLQEEREMEKQFNAYNKEFETDVAPLVKEHNLSAEALSKLREELKGFAFSETYAKVPLKEIFRIKEENLGIKTPKRSSEPKGVKVRTADVIDLENIDEDTFKNLPPEQIEKIVAAKTQSGWNRNKK